MNNAQQAVADLRKKVEGSLWKEPDAMDTWAFLVTEVAEVGDILLRFERPEYYRNTSKDADRAKLIYELGDVMVMLATLANIYNIDLDNACYVTINKLLTKHGG